MDDFCLIVAKHHLCMLRSILFPFFLIESGNFIVNLFLDIGLWYGTSENGVTCNAKFREFVSFFVTPYTSMCCNPSQLNCVRGTECVESVVTVFSGSASYVLMYSAETACIMYI